MDNCIRQTYLWLALQQSISQLKITSIKFRLQEMLLSLIQPKLVSLIQNLTASNHQKSKNKSLLTAKQVMYNQFQVGPKQVPKYRCVLYRICLPQQFKKIINVKDNHVAMVQIYADDLRSRKKVSTNATTIKDKQIISEKKDNPKRPASTSTQKKSNKRKKLE